MKLAIIYASIHHGNTLKLIEAVKKQFPDTDIFDATKILLKDLISYDVIGIASGIYMGKFHKSITPFLENNLPEHKKVFLMYTSGSTGSYGKEIETIIQNKKCSLLGTYSCLGYDTFGPFKLVGGLCKGHPTENEIAGAVEFVNKFVE